MTNTDYEAQLKERREIEGKLSGILRGLLDRPDNILLLQQLGKHGVHVSEVGITINKLESGSEKYEREMWVLKEWQRLYTKSRRYTWADFLAICASRINLAQRWRPRIAAILGMTSWQALRSYEEANFVPFDWMTQIAALPEQILPEPPPVPSNYPVVGRELTRALREAGKSDGEIAELLASFLRDFDGDRVSPSEVAMITQFRWTRRGST